MKTRRKFYSISLCLLLVSAPILLIPPVVLAAGAKNRLDDKLDFFLTELKLAYEKRSPVDFMRLVDESYAGRFEFTAGLLQQFSTYKELNVIFFVDSVFKGAAQLSVWLRWYRKGEDAANKPNVKNAVAQFLLIDRAEGYKLVQINGDNPFF